MLHHVSSRAGGKLLITNVALRILHRVNDVLGLTNLKKNVPLCLPFIGVSMSQSVL